MDRDPRISPETTAQQRTASDPTIWGGLFQPGRRCREQYWHLQRNGRADLGFKLSLQLRASCHYNGRTSAFRIAPLIG
jgi:hypothetical protein